MRILVEDDMKRRACDKDAQFAYKVFAMYPLIGSMILSAKQESQINENVKYYIDKKLNDPRNCKFERRQDMQIAIAIINIAKKWDSEVCSKFWEYILLQLGYREDDSDSRIVQLLQTALENAMKNNRRFFVEGEKARGFKSTILVHALSTKKSWMHLLDFLFDFYKNNLAWKLISGDPILDVMIISLQKRLSGDEEDDVELKISNKVYLFQEGIRKLVLLRPGYTRVLFEKMLKNIESLVNSEEIQIKRYEDELCKQWFEEKITNIANKQRKLKTERNAHREVAIDYTSIRPRLSLSKDSSEIRLELPDIRLKSGDTERAELIIKYNGYKAKVLRLDWYGNELGKTLIGCSVTLPDLCPETDTIAMEVEIVCDGKAIYKSGNLFHRNVFVFYGSSEIGASQITRDNFLFVVPSAVRFIAKNSDVIMVENFKIAGYKAFYVEFGRGYLMQLNNQIVAIDNIIETDISIIDPLETEELPQVVYGDKVCQLVYKNSKCQIVLENQELQKRYRILRNDEIFELQDLSKNEIPKQFEINIINDEKCHIQVIDLSNEHCIYDKTFISVVSARCGFDRCFYYESEDYENAEYRICIDNVETAVHFGMSDDEVVVPYKEGIIRTKIPKVSIAENTKTWMFNNQKYWFAGSISQDSILNISVPCNTKIKFMLNGRDLKYDGQGELLIGNIVRSAWTKSGDACEPLEVQISRNARTEKYLIANICYKEKFERKPEFSYRDGKLYWDHGGRYIGKSDRDFSLVLCNDKEENKYSFTINEFTDSIDIPETIRLGRYKYTISYNSGSIFKREECELESGECIIGDKDELRFIGKKIIVCSITDPDKKSAGHIKVAHCEIDRIVYKGIEDTSEGRCPVYEGVLYGYDSRGVRHDFSYDNYITKGNKRKVKCNPVRIVYVGVSTLCITDSDGDGLYYYRVYNRERGENKYFLTDNECTKENKSIFSIADLYDYKIEEISHV